MAPHEQVYGGSGLSRLPPSMQSLRERIGGLKAASESGTSRNTAEVVSSQAQEVSKALEEATDRDLNQEQASRALATPLKTESTPLQRRRSSWETELDEYLVTSSDAAAGLDLRGRLHSPEAWLKFLQREEDIQRSNKGAVSASQIGISRLYEWATKAIPRSLNISNEAYVQIWIGYAKQQR